MTGDGYRRLGFAVLLRAWADAHSRNGAKAAHEAGIPAGVGLAGDARAFLESPGARWLVLAMELDAGGLERVLGGLPSAERRQLRLPGCAGE